MRCILNGKKVHIYPLLLKKLGKGKEGRVYEYKGMALKLYYYYTSITGRIGLKECEYLKQIDTKRIVLPKDILQDEKYNFYGYISELIIPSKEDLYQINKAKFLNELYALRKEIEILSQNYIRVNDWIPENFMYDGMFHFVDPGEYQIDWYQIYGDKDISEIQDWNNDALTRFIIYFIIRPKWSTMANSYQFYQDFKKMYQENYSTIEEYFKTTMSDNDTLESYIKKIKIK